MNVFFAKANFTDLLLSQFQLLIAYNYLSKFLVKIEHSCFIFEIKKKCYFRVVMTKNGYQKWKFRLDLSVIVVNDCLIILPAEKVEKQNYFRAQDSHLYLE